MLKSVCWLGLLAILAPSIAQAQSQITATTVKAADGGLTVNPPNTPIFGSILGTVPLTQNATSIGKLTDLNNGIPIAAPTAIGNGTLSSSNILFTTPNVNAIGAF